MPTTDDAPAPGAAPTWMFARNLTERRDLLRGADEHAMVGGAPGAAGAARAARAAGAAHEHATVDGAALLRRHEQWADRPIHRSVEDLAARLAVDGISLEEYARLTDPGPARAHDPAPWERFVATVLGDWADLDRRGRDLLPRRGEPGTDAMAALLRPFARAALESIERDLAWLRADDPHGVLADPGLAWQLWRGLPDRLLLFAARVVVLEVHVERLRLGLGEDGVAQAARSFEERLPGGGAAALLGEYQVLARLLAEQCIAHRRNAAELAARARDDHRLLGETFAGGALGTLVEVCEPWGDAHHGGRCVRALGFADGTRLLYKPRPLALDVLVAELLDWLNRRGVSADQRPVRAVDRGDYGWTEVIEAAPCRTRADVERFWRRQGGLLAVAHVLAARDLHFENVIAAGAHPVAVDLEACFHPQLVDTHDAAHPPGGADLLDTGLLPRGVTPLPGLGDGHGAGDLAAFDASGMAGRGGRLPMRAPRISGDDLRVSTAPVEMPAAANLPQLDGAAVPPRDHAEAVVAGFEEVCAIVRRHADELLAPDGLLQRAAGAPVRLFVRPSNAYGRLLHAAGHPDVLRDALDLERLLDALWRDAGDEPLLRAAFPEERRALLAGDIPMFLATADGVRIGEAGGGELAVTARRSGLDVARERIARLDDERVAHLRWVVRASLAATVAPGDDPRWPRLVTARSDRPAPSEVLRGRAAALAGTIAARAEPGADGLAWLGLDPVGDGWGLVPADLGLYNGLAGIVLFLAYAGACTGDAALRRRACEGLDTLRRTWERRLDDDAGAPLAPERLGGAFGELGGSVHVLTHLSVLLDRPELAREAAELCALAERRLDDVRENDVVAGIAGTLAVVLTLHEVHADPALLRLARRCGALLEGRARAHGDAVGWASGEGVELAGFAHGASGVAGALARLAAATGESRWLTLAERGRRFEERLFSPEHGNWRDVREEHDGVEVFPVHWCHGAPGVALARAQLSRTAGDRAAGELLVALDTTAAATVHGTHCLCHGSLGALLVLRRCRDRLRDAGRPDPLPALVPGVLDTLDRHGVVCGVPDGVATPGLMLGLAGVGYALLALADPALPSLVGLDELPA